jgi:hypothetical protein
MTIFDLLSSSQLDFAGGPSHEVCGTAFFQSLMNRTKRTGPEGPSFLVPGLVEDLSYQSNRICQGHCALIPTDGLADQLFLGL